MERLKKGDSYSIERYNHQLLLFHRFSILNRDIKQEDSAIEYLERKLGLGHALAIVVGTVIGSGVFINLPIVARTTGSPMMAALAWFLGGLVWIPQILIITEMATAYPQQGFGYLYLREAGSPALSFLYVWSAFLTSDTPSITIISLAAASALSVFWPPLNGPLLSRAFAILLIIVLTVPHYRDVRQGGNLQVVLTLIKLSPLVLLILIGAFYLDSGNLYTPAITSISSHSLFAVLGAGMAATVWSYAGFPNLLYMAGEIKNPSRVLPRALIGSVLGVMAAYVLISLATSTIMPHDALVAAVGSFANPFQYLPVFSKFAAGFLGLAAFISMVGATNACIMVQPRIEYAIARDGYFFPIFARVHPRYQTPHASIVIQSGLAIVLTLIGGIESLLGYFTLSYVLQNGLVYGTIFWLRRKPDYRPTYRAPFWAGMAILSILVQIFLAYGTFAAYSRGGVIVAAILIASGLPVYFYFKTLNPKPASPSPIE
ncbi:amino acid permease [candidate division KSB1 bacterium]|nr:amino acid permease [candidate division KSB1 bacterium]